MERRTYLALAGATLLAGCSGGSEEVEPTEAPAQQEGGQSTNTERETPTTTETEGPTPTETTTPEPKEPDVVIGDHSLGYEDSSYRTYPYVEAEIVNQGDAASGEISLTVDWFDANGDYLTDSYGSLGSLGAGEMWNARVYGISVDAEKVEDHDINGEFETEPPSVPDGVELVSSELLSGDEVKVRGEVANNSEVTVDYIEFIGKIYNTDGEVLGAAWTNETDFAPGQIWRVDPDWRGRDRIPQADSHEVVLDANVY